MALTQINTKSYTLFANAVGSPHHSFYTLIAIPFSMTIIRVRASISPTEDPDKVKKAILNLFPDLEMTSTETSVSGTTSSIEPFANLLVSQKIRDSTRAQMFKRLSGNTVQLKLNRQAAFVGKISFSDGTSPLGDLELEIQEEHIEELIDRIAPDTRKIAKPGQGMMKDLKKRRFKETRSEKW